MFHSRGGELFDPARESTVKFRDYDFFRIYEFAHHSVLIHPHDWNGKRYEVLVFAGAIPGSEKLLSMIMPQRHLEKQTTFYFPHLNLEPSRFTTLRIGMDGTFLGQSSQEYVSSISKINTNAEKKHFDSTQSLKTHYWQMLQATDGTSCHARFLKGETKRGVINTIFHRSIFQDDGLVYLQFVYPSFKGPEIGLYSLNTPVTKTVNSGSIDLSKLRVP